MERFKNYFLWVSLGALVLDVLISLHVITIGDKAIYEEFIQRALEILVVAGILNNPSIGTGFTDKQSQIAQVKVKMSNESITQARAAVDKALELGVDPSLIPDIDILKQEEKKQDAVKAAAQAIASLK